jgi:hypothetical protein
MLVREPPRSPFSMMVAPGDGRGDTGNPWNTLRSSLSYRGGKRGPGIAVLRLECHALAECRDAVEFVKRSHARPGEASGARQIARIVPPFGYRSHTSQNEPSSSYAAPWVIGASGARCSEPSWGPPEGGRAPLTAVADFSERRRSCGTPSEPRRPTESHRWCDAGTAAGCGAQRPCSRCSAEPRGQWSRLPL